jgi:2'-5' RNA ligase
METTPISLQSGEFEEAPSPATKPVSLSAGEFEEAPTQSAKPDALNTFQSSERQRILNAPVQPGFPSARMPQMGGPRPSAADIALEQSNGADYTLRPNAPSPRTIGEQVQGMRAGSRLAPVSRAPLSPGTTPSTAYVQPAGQAPSDRKIAQVQGQEAEDQIKAAQDVGGVTAARTAISGAQDIGEQIGEPLDKTKAIQGLTKIIAGGGGVAMTIGAPELLAMGTAAFGGDLTAQVALAKVTAGIAAGAGASAAAGSAAQKFNLSPEATELLKTTAFFLPSFAGAAAAKLGGLREGGIDAGDTQAYGVSAAGGKVRAGAVYTPEAYDVRAAVGDRQFGVRIPRQPAPPSAAQIAAEGTQTSAAATATQAAAVSKAAEDMVNGVPPPQPPAPPMPEGMDKGTLTPAVVQSMAQVIQSAPPQMRGQMALEAHGKLADWMLKTGKFIDPDGKLQVADSPQKAATLAQQVINDEVDRQTKATEDAAKQQEAVQKEQEKALADQQKEQEKAAAEAQKVAETPNDNGLTPAELQYQRAKTILESEPHVTADKPPVSLIQQRLRIGFAQAKGLVDQFLAEKKQEQLQATGTPVGSKAEPTLEESRQTVDLQMAALAKGNINSVMLPEGSKYRPVVPPGMKVIILKGDQPGAGYWIYNPQHVQAATIKAAAKAGTHGALLGHLEDKESLADGAPSVVVQAHTPEGVPIQDSQVHIDPQLIEEQATILKERHPDAHISVKPPEQVLEERAAATSTEPVELAPDEFEEANPVTEGEGGQAPEQSAGAESYTAPASNHVAKTEVTGSPTEKETKYDFGSTQANLPKDSDAHKALDVARSKIAPEDLAGKGADIGDNHVTVRYGIQGDDTAGIEAYLRKQSPFEVTLGKTSSFPPSKGSDGAVVIKADAESPALRRMNAEIEKHGDFKPSDFPTYEPHATVAYVKPEAAEKYIGMNETEGKKFRIDSVAISDRNGTLRHIKLEGSPLAAENPAKAPKSGGTKTAQAAAPSPLAKGDRVSFTDNKGVERTGTLAFKGEKQARVKGDDGKSYDKIPVANLKMIPSSPSKTYGSTTSIITPTRDLAARYRLMEASDLVPSHNAQNFSKNAAYPDGVQERAYDTSKEGQARIIRQAQNYDPRYTVNDNPDATNGPPIVTPDGIVLGGNSRAMSTQRMYGGGGGAEYRSALEAKAAQFGIKPEDVKGMKNPVLVREVEHPGDTNAMRRLGTELNKVPTAAMSGSEKAVSAGKNIKAATLQKVSEMLQDGDVTLRKLMSDPKDSRAIVKMLEDDGAITERERPGITDPATGGLNDAGKSFVEDALLGSVVDDPRVMDSTPKSILNKIEGSLGSISTFAARADEWNLLPALRAALMEHGEMARAGNTIADHLAQTSMFAPERNPMVDAIMRVLDGPAKGVRKAFADYAQDSKADVPGQSLLLGTPAEPYDGFNHAFGVNLTPEEYHQALDAAMVTEPSNERSVESDAAEDAEADAGLSPVKSGGEVSERAGSNPGELEREPRGNDEVEDRSVSFKASESLRHFRNSIKAAPSTNTEAFRNWFGDSKVVDAQGNPQIVYHGTDKKFTTFSVKKATQGILWFTSNKAEIESGDVGAQGSGYILDLYASIKNPAGWKEYDKFGLGELQSRGFDGAILPNKDGSYVGFAFEPTQLKSASRNKGTWDPAHPSILRSSFFGVDVAAEAMGKLLAKAATTAPAEAMKAYIGDEAQRVAISRDLHNRLYDMASVDNADVLRTVQMLKGMPGTAKDQEAIYHHLEDPKGNPLTAEQEDILDNYLAPLIYQAEQDFQVVTEGGVPLENYVHRQVRDKGGMIDRLIERAKDKDQKGGSVGGGRLTKSAPAAKSRTMMAIQRVAETSYGKRGERQVVAIKNGRVTAYRNGVAHDMGALRSGLEMAGDIIDQRAAPYIKRVTELREEVDGAKEADRQEQLADVQGRIAELKKEQETLEGIRVRTGSVFKKGDLLTKEGYKPTYSVEATFNQRAKISRELAPLLDREEALKAGKAPMLIKNVKKLANRKAQLDTAIADRDRILDQVPADELADTIWKDSAGDLHKITQATTKEIEANTSIRYYHNAAGSVAVNYLAMSKARRAFEFLEQMKASPEFAEYSHSMKSPGAIPKGWQATQLPQFRGYFFEPHIAEVLDMYAAKAVHDPGVLEHVGNFLRTSIFFNPLIHIPNLLNHWVVEKGATNYLNPMNYPRMTKAGMKAINAVIHQNADFLEALDNGAPLQSQQFETKQFADLFFKKMHDEIGTPDNPKMIEMAKALGMAPARLVKAIYDFSSKATWYTNDIAFLQSTYEKMDRGMDLKTALTETAKHIPDYRLMTRIFDSHMLGTLMSNKAITMFGAYHYGALKSYGQMAKSLTGFNWEDAGTKNAKGEPTNSAGRTQDEEKLHGLDTLAMVGLITFVVYPLMDKILRWATGNDQAQMRRAGASTLPYNLAMLAKGEKTPTEVGLSIATPNVGLQAGAELVFNRDLRTGQRLYNPHAPTGQIAKQVGRRLAESVAPVGQGMQIAEGRLDVKKFLYSMVGVSFPLHGAMKIASMINAEQIASLPVKDSSEIAHYVQRSRAIHDYFAGDKKKFNAAMASKEFTPKEKLQMRKDVLLPPILYASRHIENYDDLVRVYKAATVEEKKQLRPLMAKRLAKLIKDGKQVGHENILKENGD